ncbi:type IV secretion system DNA-binding domain-containing protein, partial [Escherichia coli]|uniref:type IV secretion system DNA-binding domain-containing protein n=1 Tax=Escherichia coli TaxID=562 RepID=UPI00209B1060
KQQSENEVTGGRQLTDNPKDVARMLKKDGKDSDIRIGDLPIIRDSEIQNFCLHGTVGAGKSEVIRRLANYVKAIRYLQGIEHNGESFTIRDWMRGVREDQKNGWLFISSNADTHASLKPVISMWLSIAIRGLLAMGENRNRRVW